jgi:hypothetical protein
VCGQVVVESALLAGPAHHATEAARADLSQHQRHHHLAVLAAGAIRNHQARHQFRRRSAARRTAARLILPVDGRVAGGEEQRPDHRRLHRRIQVLPPTADVPLQQGQPDVGRGLHGAVAGALGKADR